MRLNNIQSTFKTILLDQPEALLDPPEPLKQILKTGDIPLHERLKVYRNNVIGSLTDTLVATFPTIEALTGKAFLEFMARSFILKHPPNHGCLNHYGRGFDQFITTFEPAQSLPYLPDIARLDIALNDAYYAPDDTPLSAKTLSNIAPEDLNDMRLRLRSSTTLIQSSYPLLSIRDFCLKTDRAKSETLDINQGGVYAMIYRPHLSMDIVTLSVDEHTMLLHLQDGEPLGESLSHTLNAYPEFDIQKFLQKHLDLETFHALGTNK